MIASIEKALHDSRESWFEFALQRNVGTNPVRGVNEQSESVATANHARRKPYAMISNPAQNTIVHSPADYRWQTVKTMQQHFVDSVGKHLEPLDYPEVIAHCTCVAR